MNQDRDPADERPADEGRAPHPGDTVNERRRGDAPEPSEPRPDEGIRPDDLSTGNDA